MAITISGSGITSANIADGTIVNADINSSAAIDGSKLTGVTPTKSAIEDLGIAASSLTGALPALDGSALTGLPGGAGVELIGKYASSTTVSLEAGTYLLVPAGGGGGSSYNGTATSGGTSSITLDGFTAYGTGGAKGTANHHTGGSAGGSGGKGHSSNGTGSYDSFYYPTIPTVSMFGGTGHPGNYGALPGNTGTDQYKTITSTQTATITVGAGGLLGGSGTYASAGTAGWCAIWKIT